MKEEKLYEFGPIMLKGKVDYIYLYLKNLTPTQKRYLTLGDYDKVAGIFGGGKDEARFIYKHYVDHIEKHYEMFDHPTSTRISYAEYIALINDNNIGENLLSFTAKEDVSDVAVKAIDETLGTADWDGIITEIPNSLRGTFAVIRGKSFAGTFELKVTAARVPF